MESASPHREASRAVTQLRYAPGWVLSVTWSVLLGQRRSFTPDAQQLVAGMTPTPRVENAQYIPAAGAFVVVTNHYYKPGYSAWWGVALIAAAIAQARPADSGITWAMANRWTYPDWLRSHVTTPLTYWLFTRLARTWAFVSMPPMPVHPQYVPEGARAVRQLLTLLASAPEQKPCIGLAPEGRDSPDGSLIKPPAGTGRLLLHLADHGLPLLPVGVAEVDGVLTARFGQPFQLCVAEELERKELDRLASTRVMTAIGAQLPPELWGLYRTQIEGVVSSRVTDPAGVARAEPQA
jgi:hypothetical protein